MAVQPICELLKSLNPGTPFNNILSQGATIPVKNLISYDDDKKLATFINFNGDTVIANCEQITAVELFNG